MGGSLAMVLGHMFTNSKCEYINNNGIAGKKNHDNNNYSNDKNKNDNDDSHNNDNNNNNNENENVDNKNDDDNDDNDDSNNNNDDTYDIHNDSNNSTDNDNTDNESIQKISLHFKGCILLCPAIDIKKPSQFIVNVLDYLIVPFFGRFSIPEIIQKSINNQHLVWSNDDYINYINRDG
jgi:hypothetical protein